MDDTPEPLPYIRQTLRNMGSWNPTRLLPGERSGNVHRMDLNECPMPPSPIVIEAIRDHAHLVNRYADGGCPDLTEKISAVTGVPHDCITWGTGSAELLANIVRLAIAPGDGVVAPTPVWRRFHGVFSSLEADVAHVDIRDDGSVDPDGMIAACSGKTKIMVCVTPNNPSGAMLSKAEVRKVAEETPEDVLLYLDEAYYEFARFAGGPDGLVILQEHRKGPWIVTRTFSKAYAMAGLRMGYAMASNVHITNALRSLTGTFNVSAMSEAAALAAWEDQDYALRIQEATATERERIVDGLREMGIEALPSVTNFVSGPLDRPAGPVIQAMKERNIRIAGWAEEGYGHMIRVSIGLPEDTDAFLTALREILDAG